MNTKQGLIVLSGGMDSVTLLYEYQADIALALSFDYGSKHNARELPMAALHCRRLGIEHIIIPLGFMGQYFRSALLEGGGEIPKGAYDEENMAATVVPFRNGIMLSIAAGLAESRGLQRLYIANHFGDHAIYPDCRASFIRPMHEAIRSVPPTPTSARVRSHATARPSASTMPRPGAATRAVACSAAAVAPASSAVRPWLRQASRTPPHI